MPIIHKIGRLPPSTLYICVHYNTSSFQSFIISDTETTNTQKIPFIVYIGSFFQKLISVLKNLIKFFLLNLNSRK